ncbi:MAG: hypothetical protein HFJ06_02325 [Lachnospiraceae bacterium]|nr:hypothetical protein [Lachnospiraceae bacterium]
MPAGRWSAGCRKRPDSISCRSPCKNRVDFDPQWIPATVGRAMRLSAM